MIGMTELTFAEKLSEHGQSKRMERLCTDVTPGIIITRDLPIPIELIEASESESVPVMRTKQNTTQVFWPINEFS